MVRCLASASAPAQLAHLHASHAEILDFGYPQNSESDTLKMYITTEGVKSEQAVVRLPLSSFAPRFHR